MSCKDIKTPNSPNMRNIPRAHLRRIKSGLIKSNVDLNVITYAGGADTSQSALTVPKYDQGAQTNSDNTSAVATGGSSKVDYARVKLTSNQSISTSARVVVLFNSTDSDTNGWYTIFGHKMVPNKAGIYFVNHRLEILFDSASGDWDSSIFKNGTEFSHYNHVRFAAGGGSSLISMNGTTDELTIRVRIFATLPNAISASTSGKRSFFEIYRIGDIP